MGDLHDNLKLSTRFMKSDWLNVKCSDFEVKCKQSHVVKCSIDHQKCLVNHHVNKPTWVLIGHACVVGHMTKIPCIKSDGNGRSAHN